MMLHLRLALGSRQQLAPLTSVLHLAHYQTRAGLKPIPPQRGSIASPTEFLKAIGRDSEAKLELDRWEALWKIDGTVLKKAGLNVQDRRYILWCMEKYRQGFDVKDFAHEPKPKKKIRGRGPAVQLGKRIRSRRTR